MQDLVSTETVETEASPSDGIWKSWNIGHTVQLFPSPGRSWDLWVFPHLFCAEPAWRVVGGNGESLHANLNYCLCSQWPPSSWSMSGPISALKRQKPCPWSAPRKVGTSATWSSSYPPQGKTGTWVFCICLHCTELGGGALVNASKLPLFLAATRYLEYVRTHQHSETGKTRRQFLPQQPQDWMLNVQFSPLLRSPRRSLLLWVYCRLYGTAPGVGIIAKGCLRFYYRLQCG